MWSLSPKPLTNIVVGFLLLKEEEDEKSLIKNLMRHARLAVAWDRHGSQVPRWTVIRFGLDTRGRGENLSTIVV